MQSLAQVDGGIVDASGWLAWAHRSRALPERPHLKQWKVFWFRLAEKQRLVPEVEPCKGHGPRCWAPWRAAALEAEQLQDGGHGDGGANGGEVDGGARRGDGGARLLVLGLAQLLAAFAGLGQFAVAFGEDFLVTAFEFVLGRDVADGAVQADVCCNGRRIRSRCRRASSSDSGTWTRMHSPLRVLCQRSILPLDCG